MFLTKSDVIEARDALIPILKDFSKKFPSVPLGYYPKYSPYSDEMFHALVFPDAAKRKSGFKEELKKIYKKTEKTPVWGDYFDMEESVMKLSGETIKNAPYQFLGGKMTKHRVSRAGRMPVV